jgi:ABC-type nitrate/sulfonate/bicarbonate transport system permease component
MDSFGHSHVSDGRAKHDLHLLPWRHIGIGYFTWESYTMQKYPSIIVGMLVIGVLGMASSALVRFVGERLMPWQRRTK